MVVIEQIRREYRNESRYSGRIRAISTGHLNQGKPDTGARDAECVGEVCCDGYQRC